jgi:hypothetical protein
MAWIIEEPAYAKIVQHALKYPAFPVYGLLLGNSLKIQTVIPLCHSILVPSGPLQIALAQIEDYAVNQQSKIIGFYYANQVDTDESLPLVLDQLIRDSSLISINFSVSNWKEDGDGITVFQKDPSWKISSHSRYLSGLTLVA